MMGAARLAVTIRSEEPADYAAIYALTQKAFAPMPFAGGNEQDLVNALRDGNALEISLVAEHEGRIAGHIAFSPAFGETNVGQGSWRALGPVSVEPELQRHGIGSALINTGIKMLRQRDAAGCILVGNPDYYRRFGFRAAPQNCPVGEPAEYFQILCMASSQPDGNIDFHPVFHGE